MTENLVEFQLVVQFYFGDLHYGGYLFGEKPAQLLIREVLQHLSGIPGILVWYNDHKTCVTFKGKPGHLENKTNQKNLWKRKESPENYAFNLVFF